MCVAILEEASKCMNCEFCGKQFCNGQEIRKHMKEHKESHQKCNNCEKTMYYKKEVGRALGKGTNKSSSHCKKTFCDIELLGT